MHRELRKRYPTLQDSALPPKRALGHLKASVAEDRRLALQEYLQHMLRVVTASATSPLRLNPSKGLFLATLPFFSEDTITMDAIEVDMTA